MKPWHNVPDPQWTDWLMDNLIRGVSTERLIEALQTRKIPERIARAWIQHIKAQEDYSSQLYRTKPMRQSDLYLSLRRQLYQDQRSRYSIRELTTLDADTFFPDYYAENRLSLYEATQTTGCKAKMDPFLFVGTLWSAGTHHRRSFIESNYDMEHARHTIHCSSTSS